VHAAGDIALAQRRRSPLSVGSWIGLTFLAVLAVLGPWLALKDPNAIDLRNILGDPSPQHWLGVDSTGRDILSRLLAGAPVSLLGPLVVVILATIAGSALGIFSAWRGGWIDTFISRILDILFAFPALLLAFLAIALFGTGLQAAVIALAVAYTPYLARLVRSVALRERQLPYVAALEVQGQRQLRIIVAHVIPRLSPFILVQATLSFGYALLDLAALNFLGFGAQPPQADWGSMVADGLPALLTGHPYEAVSASLLIVVSVLIVNSAGEQLADRWSGRDD
jgi:peptide/nickel transport system permease protein